MLSQKLRQYVDRFNACDDERYVNSINNDCAKALITDYAQYYLNGTGKLFDYSTWFADSVYEYCEHCNDVAFGIQCLDRLVAYYDEFVGALRPERFKLGKGLTAVRI